MADLGVDDIAVVGVAKGPDRDAGRERFFLPGKAAFMLEPQETRCSISCSACATRRTASPSAPTARGAPRRSARSPLDEIAGVGARPQARAAAPFRLGPRRRARRRSRISSAVAGHQQDRRQKDL